MGLSNEIKTRINRHNMVIQGPLTHPFESVQLGNGDLGASVSIYPHEIKIVLAKSDITDARSNADPEKNALKHDDLIRLVKEKNRDLRNIWDEGADEPDYLVDSYTEDTRKMPEPKRAGCIRLFHPGLSDTPVDTMVHLINGVLETVFHFSAGKLVVKAFAERGCNRFWVDVYADGEVPWFIFNVEKEPDDYNITMPLPVLKEAGERTAGITQTIPAGYGIPVFDWSLGIQFPHKSQGVDAQWLQYKAWRVRQYCALSPGAGTRLCVSVATDRDPDRVGDTRTRALEMVNNAPPFTEMFEAHQKEWEKFWDTAYITLADAALESVWYRNHFGYGCALGANPLGSGGNVIIQDSIPWNGDCHMNHNFQKWYCTAFATNHPEWIELYARFVAEKLPLFTYQADLLFGIEGAYVDISYFTFMDFNHSNIINHVGRALAVTGWVGAPLWHHYEYFCDKDWLREKAYPFLKAAAQFYYNYLEKYSNEDNEIYPSIRLEEPAWTKDFIGCRNTVTDLCMFKKAFDRAISASEVLDVDGDWRAKWTEARARVPEIEHGIDEDGNGWLSLDKDWPKVEPKRRADESRYSRWGGGGWIVYPGEYIPGDGDDPLTLTLRNMLAKTDLMNPFISEITRENMYPGVPVIHPISSIVPSIRLGLTQHFNRIRAVLLAHRLTYGQASSYMLSGGAIPKEINFGIGFMWYDWRSVENKYAGVLAVNEMLLQSQGGIVRLFPFLPEDFDASFHHFRAQGGFVISAVKKGKNITATVLSEAGRDLSYKNAAGEVVVIKTQPGETYTI